MHRIKISLVFIFLVIGIRTNCEYNLWDVENFIKIILHMGT